jgi:hypothetical protein
MPVTWVLMFVVFTWNGDNVRTISHPMSTYATDEDCIVEATKRIMELKLAKTDTFRMDCVAMKMPEKLRVATSKVAP